MLFGELQELHRSPGRLVGKPDGPDLAFRHQRLRRGQEVGHLRVQVPGGISPRNAMVAVGVVEGFKLLVCRDECID